MASTHLDDGLDDVEGRGRLRVHKRDPVDVLQAGQIGGGCQKQNEGLLAWAAAPSCEVAFAQMMAAQHLWTTVATSDQRQLAVAACTHLEAWEQVQHVRLRRWDGGWRREDGGEGRPSD